MKTTINTALLKSLLNKVSKCASNNKMLPLTCMTCIDIRNNKITLVSTNGSDYMYVYSELNAEDFYVVIDNDIFTKLISKITTDTLSLELVEHQLIVVGNGRYTLSLPVDENGELIKYPNPLSKVNYNKINKIGEINKNNLSVILKTNKANLSTSLAEPCYTGYFIGNKVMTSDRSVICCTDVNVLNNPILVNSEVMSALDDTLDVAISQEDTELILNGIGYTIYTHKMEGIEYFNHEAILDLVNTDLSYSCNISKVEILNALDRLSLFINSFNKNCITLKFDRHKLNLISNDSIETIAINEGAEFECNIDIEVLKKQLNAQDSSVIKLSYGNDTFIKLSTDLVTQIIPLLVE